MVNIIFHGFQKNPVFSRKIEEQKQDESRVSSGGLNSNLQAKTKNISQSESNDIESLINLIISNTKGQNNGIFNICGSWKNHPRGYSAIVQKIVYDKLSIKISGIIFSLDGNGWNFTSHITNDETITKIFFFAMS